MGGHGLKVLSRNDTTRPPHLSFVLNPSQDVFIDVSKLTELSHVDYTPTDGLTVGSAIPLSGLIDVLVAINASPSSSIHNNPQATTFQGMSSAESAAAAAASPASSSSSSSSVSGVVPSPNPDQPYSMLAFHLSRVANQQVHMW